MCLYLKVEVNFCNMCFIERKLVKNILNHLDFKPKRTISEVTQSCPNLCDPMDCSLPDSSIHGILQARILEWVAISFSRGSFQPTDRTCVSRIAGSHFNL